MDVSDPHPVPTCLAPPDAAQNPESASPGPRAPGPLCDSCRRARRAGGLHAAVPPSPPPPAPEPHSSPRKRLRKSYQGCFPPAPRWGALWSTPDPAPVGCEGAGCPQSPHCSGPGRRSACPAGGRRGSSGTWGAAERSHRDGAAGLRVQKTVLTRSDEIKHSFNISWTLSACCGVFLLKSVGEKLTVPEEDTVVKRMKLGFIRSDEKTFFILQ